MVRRLPKRVSEYRDRHGTLRVRYRRQGCATYYFKAKVFSRDFWAEYEACENGTAAPPVVPGRDRIIPGSVADLITRYYGSSDWLGGMSEATRHVARRIIDKMRVALGDDPVAAINYARCQAILGRMADRPHAHNRFRKLMKRVWDEGVRHGLASSNPWALTKPARESSPGFHTWTEDEIAAFQAVWPIGSKPRLALELMLLTAQRGGDVRTLGPQHRKGDVLVLTQSKTRAALKLEIVPALAAVLDATPSGHLAFIVTEQGQPFTPRGFGQWFARACDAAGLPHCRAHGLRKAAARRLAEGGATVSQIKAWTGHRSDREVARYTSDANQAQLNAASAHLMANPAERLANSKAKPLKRGK